MKQHRVIFSIGSNIGNRLSYLQKAIEALHEKVGWIVHVSSVYETPAWGFTSTPFLNAALVLHTYKSPEQIRPLFLEIENSLGRKREDQSGYAARTIDIDLIAFDELQLQTKDLSIPHPLMEKRKFVLAPILEIAPHWIHPVLKKNTQALFDECEDASEIKAVNVLQNPSSKYNFSSIHFMAIEGNIGAGKTTLTQKISEDFGAKAVYEGFADNPFLPKFYQDPSRYALPLEMSFLAERYSQLADNLNQLDLFHPFTVADYYIFKSLIFAQVTLEADEFQLYKSIFDIMYHQAQKPDIYVYLLQDTDQLLYNIQKRGRSYESEIAPEYLSNLHKGYIDFIQSLPSSKTIIIDMSNRDFVQNQSDYLYVLDEIQKKLGPLFTSSI